MSLWLEARQSGRRAPQLSVASQTWKNRSIASSQAIFRVTLHCLGATCSVGLGGVGPQVVCTHLWVSARGRRWAWIGHLRDRAAALSKRTEVLLLLATRGQQSVSYGEGARVGDLCPGSPAPPCWSLHADTFAHLLTLPGDKAQRARGPPSVTAHSRTSSCLTGLCYLGQVPSLGWAWLHVLDVPRLSPSQSASSCQEQA